ncbi:MAG: cytochrome c biogenesis protein CcsA [Myxococcota bacterium]
MTRASSNRPPILWLALAVVTTVLLGITLYMIFFFAPIERQMGIAQKIFYIHVPSAWGMYIGFVTCGICSGIHLFTSGKKGRLWDSLAVSGAEIGVLFCMAVLVTGPLWARKAWGIWWTWDPRLTSTMLAGLVFLSYLALRSFGTAGAAERRFASALGLLGLLVLPIIHYATRRWGGQHPTVITDQGGGLHPDMAVTFGVSSVAFVCLAILLLWTRSRMELSRRRLQEADMTAIQSGLLEEA